MPTVWALFNLGPLELLILAGMGMVPLVIASVVVLIVLTTTRKKRDAEEE